MLLKSIRLSLILAAAAGVSAPVAARSPVAAAAHQRVLPLQGGQNFRDLGGYRTRGGRSVRWGALYRSGSMHFLTPADYTYLNRLGIRTVCDFRDTAERAAGPVQWPAGQAPTILADDYDQHVGDLGRTASGRVQTPAEARGAMIALYPGLLTRFNGQYRRMFGELLAGRTPLAFNCSAGKDRTGVAAALILTALDVPRQTVIDDYLLTNRYFDPHKIVRGNDRNATSLQALPPAVLKPYMLADRSYIGAVFGVLDAHRGGANGYLHDELGLSAADLAKLRQLYTQ